MGSPSARLNTKESLRPWLESGLEYVLHPGGQPTALADQAAMSGQQSQPQAHPAPQQSSAPVSNPAPPAPASQQAPPQQNAPVAPSGFADPWSGFFAKVPQSPKIVWTYMELGLDFGGQADAKRRAILQSLISYMDWPPKSIAFWPMSALTDGALQPNKDMFWKGWDLWRTPNIACFGEEALRVILPEAEPGNTTYLYEHVTVHVLPPMAKLVQMLPHEVHLAVDALKNIRF